MVSQLCLTVPKLRKGVGDCLLLQLPNELPGSAGPLRSSTPVSPVEVHSFFSISERLPLFSVFLIRKRICSITLRFSTSLD